MSVYARVLLFILAGHLLSAGWISQEVKDMITTDPSVADLVQGLLASIVAFVALAWRWAAKRLGWST